jgi:adenylate kinase
MKVVVVTGTPGAGKTTVLNRAIKRLNKEFEVVNYGDAMFEVAEKKEIVKHRDELRKQPPEIQKEIQRLAAEKIAKKAKERQVIVDTHCSIKTPTGYLPGLPKWVLEELNPDVIVLIEADPEEILGRRIKDTTRVRDVEYVAEIKEHQEINRATAMAYAVFTGATVKIVKNHNNELDKAIEDLVAVLR